MIMDLGSKLSTWRTISLPMEPAAPVIKIVLSFNCFEMDLSSRTIGLRSNKSSIWIFLIF